MLDWLPLEALPPLEDELLELPHAAITNASAASAGPIHIPRPRSRLPIDDLLPGTATERDGALLRCPDHTKKGER
jgi:hypothetical protein